MKMKAAVVDGLDLMAVREVDKPEIDDLSMMLKVKATAVCGSDIRIFHHGNNRVSYPAIIGHEISGEIVEVGKLVHGYQVGDRVALGADVPCGECIFCKAGIGNNCQINYAMGYQFQGGFAEYVPLNAIMVNHGPITKLPDHVSYEEGALAEPLACVLNALELSPVKLGDVVVVIGAGPIGCMLAEVAKKMGAAKVIVLQRSTPRLELAKKTINADIFVSTLDEDGVERVLKETGGLGADVIFTANPSPETQAQAIMMAKNRARVNFFGGLPKDQSEVKINTNQIHYKELFITGAHGSMPHHHMQAVDLIASGTIDIKKFISHKFRLDDVKEAFKTAESNTGMRVVVKP